MPGKKIPAESLARPAECPAARRYDGSTLLILEHAQPVALILALYGHIIAAGGKQLRPMLTLATSRLCGLSRRPPHRPRRRGRIHPHRHPAA